MKKKNILILISAIVLAAAAVAAVIVYREQIGSFFDSLRAKLKKPAPQPHFTAEERASFADI